LDDGRRLPRPAPRGEREARGRLARARREGEPRKVALAYFALGPNATDDAGRYLLHYYDIGNADFPRQVASSAATDPKTVKQYVDAFTEAGADELILFPCSTDPAQVDRLAEVAL
jgi:hypothetical protein